MDVFRLHSEACRTMRFVFVAVGALLAFVVFGTSGVYLARRDVPLFTSNTRVADEFLFHKYSTKLHGQRDTRMQCKSAVNKPFLQFVRSSTRVPFMQAVLLPSIDKFVSIGVRQFGTWDVHVGSVLDFVIDRHGCWGASARGKISQRVLLDVGSNIGFLGAQGASRGCSVHAFEPQRMASVCAFATSCVNGWQRGNASRPANRGLLHVHRAPVSSLKNVKFPIKSSENVGGVSTHVCLHESSDCEELKPVLLDDFIATHTATDSDNPVLALKIDAEGFDVEVAETASNSISRGWVTHVFLEVTPSRLGAKRNVEFLQFLQKSGYHLAEVPYQTQDRSLRTQMIRAIPLHNVSKFVETCLNSKCLGLDGENRHFSDVWATKNYSDFEAFNKLQGFGQI